MLRVARSREMARFLEHADVARHLKEYWKDRGWQQEPLSARYTHLDASSGMAQRKEALGKLGSAKGAVPQAILNVGLFGEGTDCPALSAVAFIEPRESVVDVVQAVGRVMRRAPGKELGFIIVPIIIPDDTDAETYLSSHGREGWKTLGQVLLALRGHDDRIEDQLKDLLTIYAPRAPERIRTVLGVVPKGQARAIYCEHEGALAEADARLWDLYNGKNPQSLESVVMWASAANHKWTAAVPSVFKTLRSVDGQPRTRQGATIRTGGGEGELDRTKTKERMKALLKDKSGGGGKETHSVVGVWTSHGDRWYWHQGDGKTAVITAAKAAAKGTVPERIGLKVIEPDQHWESNPEYLVVAKKLERGAYARIEHPETVSGKDGTVLYNHKRTVERGLKLLDEIREEVEECLDLSEANQLSINLLEQSGIRTKRRDRDANMLEEVIREGARLLKDDAHEALLNELFGFHRLTEPTKDRPREDSTVVAALRLVGALLLQARLEQTKRHEAWVRHGIEKIAEGADARIIDWVEDDWRCITKRNHRVTIDPAWDIVARLKATDTKAGLCRALRYLARQAGVLAPRYAELGSDHIGAIWNKFMNDKRSDGAWFTRPPAAVLAAELALDMAAIPSWRTESVWKEFKTVDLACGSGTLLTAILHAAKHRARTEGADGSELERMHKTMVEESIVGLDINETSLQLAGTQLTLGDTSLQYRRMQLMRMPYGMEHERVHTGTLELLASQNVVKSKVGLQELLPNEVPLAENIGEESQETADATLAVQGTRLVIMNPPFSSREKMGQKFKEGRLKAGLRKRVDTLDSILGMRDPEMNGIAGKNSTQPLFVAIAEHIADQKEGMLAMVAPSAMLTATEAEIARKVLSERFHIETIVTSFDPGASNISVDTNINESLVLCRRRQAGEVGTPTRFVQLDSMPHNEEAARILANSLRNGSASRRVAVGWWPEERMRAGDWSRGIWYSDKIAEFGWEMKSGRAKTKIALVGLASEGRKIHATGRQLRGRCRQTAETEEGSLGAFEIFKSKSEYAQRRIEGVPDEIWIAKKGDPILTERHFERMGGHLLVSAGQRMESGRLSALYSKQQRVGNGWMPVSGSEREYAKALAVWLNSTPGRIAIMGGRGRTLGFPNYSAKHAAGLPVPTKSAVTAVEGLADTYERTKHEQIGQFRDGSGKARIAWDDAVVEHVLGVAWKDRIRTLREDLDMDPYVRGTDLPEAPA